MPKKLSALDILRDLAVDPDLPKEKRAELAARALNSEDEQRRDAHEIRLAKIKAKPEAKRNLVEARDLAREEQEQQRLNNKVPVGKEVFRIIEDYKNGENPEETPS
jgi:hypothetical protein